MPVIHRDWQVTVFKFAFSGQGNLIMAVISPATARRGRPGDQPAAVPVTGPGSRSSPPPAPH
jgi:hypothetical protein